MWDREKLRVDVKKISSGAGWEDELGGCILERWEGGREPSLCSFRGGLQESYFCLSLHFLLSNLRPKQTFLKYPRGCLTCERTRWPKGGSHFILGAQE